ncbi:MAG: hypothetical protein O7A06_09635, partial [Acidobacteria bacterium]|nr:hypothetical protein [Acidobacteriota bacterium]
SVRTSGALLVAVFVMASWVALLCEARCLVPASHHSDTAQTLPWSSIAGPAPQKHHHPVPSQVKLCIIALPGAFLSAQTLSSSATVAAIPAKASDGVSAEFLARPTTFSLATVPVCVSPKPSLLVLRI